MSNFKPKDFIDREGCFDLLIQLPALTMEVLKVAQQLAAQSKTKSKIACSILLLLMATNRAS